MGRRGRGASWGLRAGPGPLAPVAVAVAAAAVLATPRQSSWAALAVACAVSMLPSRAQRSSRLPVPVRDLTGHVAAQVVLHLLVPELRPGGCDLLSSGVVGAERMAAALGCGAPPGGPAALGELLATVVVAAAAGAALGRAVASAVAAVHPSALRCATATAAFLARVGCLGRDEAGPALQREAPRPARSPGVDVLLLDLVAEVSPRRGPPGRSFL